MYACIAVIMNTTNWVQEYYHLYDQTEPTIIELNWEQAPVYLILLRTSYT